MDSIVTTSRLIRTTSATPRRPIPTPVTTSLSNSAADISKIAAAFSTPTSISTPDAAATSDPSSDSNPVIATSSTNNNNPVPSSSNLAAKPSMLVPIVAGVAGVVIFGLLAILIIYFCKRRRNGRAQVNERYQENKYNDGTVTGNFSGPYHNDKNQNQNQNYQNEGERIDNNSYPPTPLTGQSSNVNLLSNSPRFEGEGGNGGNYDNSRFAGNRFDGGDAREVVGMNGQRGQQYGGGRRGRQYNEQPRNQPRAQSPFIERAQSPFIEQRAQSPFLDPVVEKELRAPIPYPVEDLSVSPFPDSPGQGDIKVVKRTFEPSLGDELVIAIGDRVKVLMSYDDGWALGINLSSSSTEKGVFPYDCLVDSPTTPSSTTDPSNDLPLPPTILAYSPPPSTQSSTTTASFTGIPVPSSTTLGVQQSQVRGQSPSYPFPITPASPISSSVSNHQSATHNNYVGGNPLQVDDQIVKSNSSNSLAVSEKGKRGSKRASSLVATRDQEMFAALDF